MPTAIAEAYLLGPQDRVRVKVFEWRASHDTIFEWDALNDVFTVGADGTLFLPFAGEIGADGLAPEQVAEAIAEGLKQNMGLGRRPDTSVEVIEFRPFYILGDVTQPGAFPYRPGLTVLQALALAGGLRTQMEELSRFQRETIQGRGEISLLGLERINLLARKARLDAELAGSENIAFPDRLTQSEGDPVVSLVMEEEQQIFQARREAIETQTQVLDNLSRFLENELVALETQLGLLDRQTDLIRMELDNVSSLVSKGLATAPREMSLERALAQSQSERLSAETSLLRTRQEASRTEITRLEMRNLRANEITAALRETQAALDALDRRVETALHLLHETEFSAMRLGRADASQIVYTIVRTTESRPAILPADEMTPLRPGDTVKVEIPLPSNPAVTADGSADLTRSVDRTASAARPHF